MGLGLCGVAHPVELVDVLAERLLEVLHEIDHLCLRGLREVFGHVHLADCLTEDAVRNLHGPLPARFLLLDAGHLGAEEIAERSGRALDELAGHIVLEDSEVSSAEIFAESLEERRFADDQFLLVGDSSGLEVEFPVEARVILDEFLGAARVVLSLDIPFLNAGPGVGGEDILDRESIGGSFLRLGHSGQ